MKNAVKRLASNGINQSAKFFRLLHEQRSNTHRRAVVLTPSWKGSLGDEAVVKASTDYLTSSLHYAVDLLTFNDGIAYPEAASIASYINIPNYFRSGGWPERMALSRRLAHYDHFFLLGTDSLDGHYSEWQSLGLLTLAEQAATSGIATTIVGFSMQEDPKTSCMEALQRIARRDSVRLCIRDGISKRRVEGNLEKTSLTADPAFLLKPAIQGASAEAVLRWIKQQRSSGDLILGINLSSHVLQCVGSPGASVLESSVCAALSTVRQCTGRQIAIVLIPHDLRPHCDDLGVCQALATELTRSSNVSTIVFTPPITAASVKAVIAHMDFVFSGRMHLAIAALGMGIPVACISYQGKFEGLYQHFGLDPITISPKDACQREHLARFLERSMAECAALRLQIKSALPMVTELASANFQ